MAQVSLTETIDEYGKTYNGTVEAGDYAIVETRRKDASVAWHPTTGGAATVKYSLSPVADVRTGAANWLTKETENSVADAESAFGPVTAIWCEAVGAAVVFEVAI